MKVPRRPSPSVWVGLSLTLVILGAGLAGWFVLPVSPPAAITGLGKPSPIAGVNPAKVLPANIVGNTLGWSQILQYAVSPPEHADYARREVTYEAIHTGQSVGITSWVQRSGGADGAVFQKLLHQFSSSPHAFGWRRIVMRLKGATGFIFGIPGVGLSGFVVTARSVVLRLENITSKGVTLGLQEKQLDLLGQRAANYLNT